jgi:hypothetical protein
VGRFVRKTRAFGFQLLGALEAIVRGAKAYEERAKELHRMSEELQRELTSTDGQVLFITIGRALTVWAKLEEFLVFVVAHLLLIRAARAGLVMYSIVNFNVWLSIIHDLMQDDKIYAPMLPRWNKISERIRRVKDQRDRLAHHSVKIASATLGPSKFDTRSKSKAQRPLDHHEVNEFLTIILGICDALEAFVVDMGDLLPPSDLKSVESDPDHSTESSSQ